MSLRGSLSPLRFSLETNTVAYLCHPPKGQPALQTSPEHPKRGNVSLLACLSGAPKPPLCPCFQVDVRLRGFRLPGTPHFQLDQRRQQPPRGGQHVRTCDSIRTAAIGTRAPTGFSRNPLYGFTRANLTSPTKIKQGECFKRETTCPAESVSANNLLKICV